MSATPAPAPTPYLTKADNIVLKNLLDDLDRATSTEDGETKSKHSGNDAEADAEAIQSLLDMNDPASSHFIPTVFTTFDIEDRPSKGLRGELLRLYTGWAQGVVRRPVDVVFLNHIFLYLATSVPSAIYLFYNFTYPHAVFHVLMQLYYTGPFTLMLHNHIHNGGVLSSSYAWLDLTFPYVLEPLMGHSWDSYYYHHTKHHHVEGNGPYDLSSTIRYQRDELLHFLCYLGRFLTLTWIELPRYFILRGRHLIALKMAIAEFSYFGMIILAARYKFLPALFVFIIPLSLTRIGLMIGNWGQHAFVDEIDPDSDFRSSITLIDEPSNRHCFNDGYHTSHHLNPRRHWRDHPVAFLKAKEQYQTEYGLVFQNIDYLMITVNLVMKNYDHLARCMIPIGSQIGMSHEEIVEMLKTKTRRFTEEDIKKKFPKYKG